MRGLRAGRLFTALTSLAVVLLVLMMLVLIMLVTGCGDPDADRSSAGVLSGDGSGATADAGTDSPGSNSETGKETASTTGSDGDAASTFVPLDPAKLGTVERDVTYGRANGVDLKMDIYYPLKAAGPVPVVMYVHGGGWTKGDKQDGAGTTTIPSLQEAGFLVVSVNYRLAPEYRFPAQIEDVKCALRYLRANAGKYALDPDRIGAWGGSAGGHLVSLLGVMDDDDGLEGSCGNQDESSRVQAVVDMFGPSDLTREFEGGAIGKALGARVFGTSDSGSEILKIASPVTYVTADDPPFLILQGDSDMLVPPDQSQGLYDLLKAAGVPATLVMVKNAGHAFVPQGGEIDPSRQEINAMIVDFFVRELM
ncbi:MAG: alpha/beta hydrolase [Actinobacteria bacterium]|nr:alpha/beta hydrolase [Actinomycetota bacterium]